MGIVDIHGEDKMVWSEATVPAGTGRCEAKDNTQNGLN